MSTKKEFLFQEFPAVSAKEWKQKIQVDLKGADYASTLVWNTPENILVKPFYHQDFFEEGNASTPFYPKTWDVTQHIFIDDESIASKLAVDAVNRGAQAIYFTAQRPFDSRLVFGKLDSLPVSVKLFLRVLFLEKDFIKKIGQYFSQKKITSYILIDPIGQLAKTGNWFINYDNDFATVKEIASLYPEQPLIGVDTSLYQQAGATITQQLAYAMAHVNEYFNYIHNHLPTVKPKITFQVSVGSNYFFEIAKLRAIRKLFAVLAEEYNFSTQCNILAIPSKRNKTLYDYNVNLLRTTTECMSAVLGGADAVCNLPYDAIYHKSNEFGERISRNQLLILKEESYFNFDKNPTEGTYYIETLINQLSENALTIFKDIEKGGGFIKQLFSGKIQQKITESAQREQHLFDEGKKVLLGTNKYPNSEDKMKNNLELYPFSKYKKRKTISKPIIEKRLSENIEQERIKNEK